MRVRRSFILVIVFAVLGCAGSWAASQVRSMRDRSEVAKMTEKMKTVCVGRYLIDVPTQAELSLTHERIDGFEIESVEESELKFRQRIGEREAEINRSGTEPSSTGPGRIVETHELRISGMIGRVVTFGRTRSHEFVDGRRVNVEWVSVEAHAHIRGRSFTLSAKYVDESDASAAEALLTRLQLRAADEIPKVPGFCISHAMFAEPLPEHRSEQVAMHLSMPDHSGLALTLLSVAGGRPGPGLLARYKQIEANASADEILRVTKLRSEPRSINGLTGEELIERIREFNFTTTYTLNWESRGTQGDLLLPYLSLEAQVGMGERPGATPAGASLHEDALLILWDSVASSIRQRKGDLPPHSGQVHEPSGPKLGAVASAGDISPQSGWWRCSEGGPGFDVHGGQTQYVRRGDRMPQALLLPHQTLWQKLKRIQPSVENNQPTVWTLVDKRLRPRKMAAVNLAPAIMPATGLDLEVDEGRPVAVGTYVRTGDKCPASGWWRCEEPHALDGTRWFARGSLLPAATFQVPAGVFAKSTGPEVIQRRSAWELMRHAETPSVTQAAPPNHDGLPVDEPPALA
jgi:hypothetical protein